VQNVRAAQEYSANSVHVLLKQPTEKPADYNRVGTSEVQGSVEAHRNGPGNDFAGRGGVFFESYAELPAVRDLTSM